jgi:hypothetical protein
MTELQSIEENKIQRKKQVLPKYKQAKPIRVTTRITAKAPTCKACEVPILTTLSRAPNSGLPTKEVLSEVTKWFDRLDQNDRIALYPHSKKKITQTIIKYSRKNLVLKGQILPAGESNPVGIWRITPKGLERVMKGREEWAPKYSSHDAIIIEEEK